MPNSHPLRSASSWTRLLLAALGLTLFALGISGFLSAILNAAGDGVGSRAFSGLKGGLAWLAAGECIGMLLLLAIRLEWDPRRAVSE
ncbi:hypothetical protein Pan44_33170 [Caulifigura coniformis]|uniref:Uncharacterized protein n=1 Tax=Caulifigura coniformis TaxID=2527983 RepID=A0A517SGM5_9PLAN|nr:hypothetical protein [Caulifigura coniformis]QDT55274.1 hypothetical protein Pan44_33170 [Caulifigura coniformis]